MRLPRILVCAAAIALAACSREPAPVVAPPAPAPAAAAAPVPVEPLFSEGELAQLVAPIALYPDALLAQVLMASTYPGDVVDAGAWSRAYPDLTGDAAVVEAGRQPWDPSVQSLVAFPQVVAMLAQDPEWVQRLGDAFLAQPEDVLDAVQRLRRKARDAGHLASNDAIHVGTEAASAGTDGVAVEPLIVIEAADTEYVHVPAYDPGVVYGDWEYDDYPPEYYPPDLVWYPGGALGTVVRWGVGIAIADALWGDPDWDGGRIDVDVEPHRRLHPDARDVGAGRWTHDPRERGGVPYRDAAHREAHGLNLAGAADRTAWRGDDPARAQARIDDRPAGVDVDPFAEDRAARARAGEMVVQPSAVDRQAEQQRLREVEHRRRVDAQWRQHAENNARTRDAARQAQRARSSNGAFAGASRPANARVERDRGYSSRGRAERSGSRDAGRPVQRPSGGGGARRGGGGGGRRG